MKTYFTKGVALLLCLLAVACSKDDDDYKAEDEAESAVLGYSKVVTHTEGSGFPIVIMADGYSAADIAAGTYQTMIDQTVTALFAKQPMASLRAYCDVYAVTVQSEQSGITTTKRSTAFGTRLKSNSDVEVWGDSIKIMDSARDVLKENGQSLQNALALVILNTQQYAGMTLMTEPPTVTDSVARGFSLAYVPVGCMYNGKSYFTEVLQHEAVGHGIAKLHDEYSQDTDAPSSDEIQELLSNQKNGYYLNIHYDPTTDNDYGTAYASIVQKGREKRYLLGYHSMEPDGFGYLFAQDEDYASEQLKWYQGGATYLTFGGLYTGDNATYAGYYTIEKNFYRPTWGSLMNDVLTDESPDFNALSRYLIYARIMKVARGGASANLRSEALHNEFKSIDKTVMTLLTAAPAKGAAGKPLQTLPRLPKPRLMAAP